MYARMSISILVALLLVSCSNYSVKEGAFKNQARPTSTPMGWIPTLSINDSSISALDSYAISKKLFGEWLRRYEQPDTNLNEKLEDFNIDQVVILTNSQDQHLIENFDLVAEITYSVKPSTQHSDRWIAADGEPLGLWVDKKTMYIGVHKSPPIYSLRILGRCLGGCG